MFLIRHFAREDDAVFFSVGPEDGKDALITHGPAEIEKAGLFIVLDPFREETNAEGILKGLLDFFWGDLAKIKWCVEPVKVHAGLFGALD
jgi:hypothetical protein